MQAVELCDLLQHCLISVALLCFDCSMKSCEIKRLLSFSQLRHELCCIPIFEWDKINGQGILVPLFRLAGVKCFTVMYKEHCKELQAWPENVVLVFLWMLTLFPSEVGEQYNSWARCCSGAQVRSFPISSINEQSNLGMSLLSIYFYLSAKWQ